jgi:hypothetical protein
MGKLLLETKDREGNLAKFESEDMIFSELLRNYPGIVKALNDAGFTLLKARTPGKFQKEVTKFDGKTCPTCHSPCYDNREKKKSGEWKANAPDFTCSNKECTGGYAKDGIKHPWAVWPEQYEIV